MRGAFDKYINVAQTIALLFAIGMALHQMMESNRALEQQEYGSLIQLQQDIFALQISNSDTYVRSLVTPQDLTDSELWTVTEIIYLRLELLERFQRAYDNGIIPIEDLMDEYGDSRIYLGTEVGKIVWRKAKVDYGTDSHFVQSIERALRDEGGSLPDNVYFQQLQSDFKKRYRAKPVSE